MSYCFLRNTDSILVYLLEYMEDLEQILMTSGQGREADDVTFSLALALPCLQSNQLTCASIPLAEEFWYLRIGTSVRHM